MGTTLEHQSTPTQAPATGVTREAPAVSPLVERDRTRAAARLTQPGPGRYLAIPDGDEVALVPLQEPTTRPGRSHTADVVLEDSSVSRRTRSSPGAARPACCSTTAASTACT